MILWQYSGSRRHHRLIRPPLPPVVHPGDADAVARLCAAHTQAEHGVARDRLAPLRIKHGFSVVLYDQALDEMRGGNAGGGLARAGFHRVLDQHAQIGRIALQRGPDFHGFGHGGVP
jgi:hypothetical protein